jgi:hypothetical protein
LARGDWRIRTETATRVSCTPERFTITATLAAFEGDARIASRSWERVIPRRLV